MTSVFSKAMGSSLVMLLGCVVWLPSAAAQDLPDEPIEILETIEVPATIVIQEERHIAVPNPDTASLSPLPIHGFMAASIPKAQILYPGSSRVVRDSIADRKGIRKSVKPAKAERPPYPQFAKKQGWEGTVVLRLRVNRQGSVKTITIRKSSGFPLLDDSAKQTVKTWIFEPAKDGEFPIPVVVDLPIRFDLEEQQ